MNNKYILSVLAFFSVYTTFSQTICNNGFAGVYPCQNYDLMSHIGLSTFGASAGNDSWGWTDPQTNKEYAIMGLNNGTAFIDISSPTSPVYLGKLPTASSNSTWRDIKVYNNYAFIVSEASNHGMQVFDLTKLRNVTTTPTTFTADAHYTGFGSAHNIVINEATGFAYAVGARNYNTTGYNYNGGAHFINIQNPTNPIAAGGFAAGGYTHDAQVVIYNGPDTQHIGKEIFIGSNETKIVIVDVTNKANPVQIGSNVTYPGVEYTHQGWLDDNHTYFYLGDELDEIRNGNNTRTFVFNFSDLDNPSFFTSYDSANTAIDHNGYTNQNELFLASYRAGLRILDITNPSNISETGYFDTYPANNNANFNGAWNVYPYFTSGNIVISDIEGGLFVVRKSGTLHINNNNKNLNTVLYPNPSRHNTTVTVTNYNIHNITVFNILGKTIFSQNNINTKSFVIPTKTLPKGIYLVKINQNITKKLIIK